MQTDNYKAKAIIDISDLLPEGEIVAFGTLDQRDIIFAIAKKPLEYTEERNRITFAKTKTTAKQDYSVYISNDGEAYKLLDALGEPFNIHHVGMITKDKVLLVCSRSEYKSETNCDLNGRIYSTDGKFLDGILLGDGIEDVQVSPNGKIWTSYFDEGVLGNYGWQSPIGHCGLAAWKDSGEKIYEYSPEMGLDYIVDCYALNVESNKNVWIYYYSSFSLVKIQDKKIVDYWTIPMRGSHAFAVHRNHALFAGGYDEKDCLWLVELLDHHAVKVIRKIVLSNIPGTDCIVARGDAMFFLSNGIIYKVCVHDLF